MAAPDSSSDVLRDYIIVKFLADRPKNSPPISSLKTDDGLLNNLKALFKEADVPEPDVHELYRQPVQPHQSLRA